MPSKLISTSSTEDESQSQPDQDVELGPSIGGSGSAVQDATLTHIFGGVEPCSHVCCGVSMALSRIFVHTDQGAQPSELSWTVNSPLEFERRLAALANPAGVKKLLLTVSRLPWSSCGINRLCLEGSWLSPPVSIQGELVELPDSLCILEALEWLDIQ